MPAVDALANNRQMMTSIEEIFREKNYMGHNEEVVLDFCPTCNGDYVNVVNLDPGHYTHHILSFEMCNSCSERVGRDETFPLHQLSDSEELNEYRKQMGWLPYKDELSIRRTQWKLDGKWYK